MPIIEVNDWISHRWSPYAFEPRSLEPEKLAACFEAARRAASSFNEQPWSFLVARREEPDEFQKMLGCLVEFNQTWARHASALVITIAAQTFQRNQSPNRTADYDLGLAVGNFVMQATTLGLVSHQMAGVDLARVRSTYRIPEGHAPVTAIALGYLRSKTDLLPADFSSKDAERRPRKLLREFVFSGEWGHAAKLS